MSEKLHTANEELLSQVDSSREAQENLKRIEQAAKEAEKDPIQKHVESLRAHAEAQAISGKEFPTTEISTERQAQSYGITKELKTDAYRRSLKRIRTHMSAPDRLMSKVIHQPAVEKVSNATARTVARPSAFLGGSFFALLASVALVYVSRHYGFTYNYAVIFLAFLAGFCIALAIEAVFKLAKRGRTF